MKVYRLLERMLLICINKIWKLFIIIHEMKNIWSKRKLYKNVKLTKEQKKEIDDFYKENYGKRIKYYWHRLYQSYTGKFDYKYVPEYIYSTKLELKNNKRINVMPYEDKNMLPVLFSDYEVKIPKTLIMCVKGKFFNKDRNIITKDRAIEILTKLNEGQYEAVIKGTVDTSSGRDVQILSLDNGFDKNSKKDIKEIIETMGKDFVVQEKIEPHKSFAKLYAKSINTLRVITYIIDSEIYVAPVTMRIGQGGGMVDNAHAGGMFIGVSDNGKLLKEAFTEYQNKFEQHPDTKIVFKDYQLPCVDKVKKCAVRLHSKVPMLDFVSWDFTINSDEEIVLIEANMHSQAVWFPQIAHGKAIFGDNTGRILREIKDRNKGNTNLK